MRRSDHARRGAPLIMLGTVIGTWAIYRAVVWQPPGFESDMPLDLEEPFGGTALAAAPDPIRPIPLVSNETETLAEVFESSWNQVLDMTGNVVRRSFQQDVAKAASRTSRPQVSFVLPQANVAVEQSRDAMILPMPARQSRASNAFDQTALRTASSSTTNLASTNEVFADVPSRQSRWSGDAWALLRDGTSTASAPFRPSYGRSQAGAAIRYDLAPDSAARPQFYSRVSTALEGAREREIAAGVSVRPIAQLPLRLHAEARYFDSSFGRDTRAAFFAVTELPVKTLPDDWRIESYAQAGYVTGDFATPFVDGQVRLTRPLLIRNDLRVEAGAGSWGGAQKGTERLDVGPTVAVTVPVGNVVTRISADYRFRVAGDAAPASGPALTLSAGF